MSETDDRVLALKIPNHQQPDRRFQKKITRLHERERLSIKDELIFVKFEEIDYRNDESENMFIIFLLTDIFIYNTHLKFLVSIFICAYEYCLIRKALYRCRTVLLSIIL